MVNCIHGQNTGTDQNEIRYYHEDDFWEANEISRVLEGVRLSNDQNVLILQPRDFTKLKSDRRIRSYDIYLRGNEADLQIALDKPVQAFERNHLMIFYKLNTDPIEMGVRNKLRAESIKTFFSSRNYLILRFGENDFSNPPDEQCEIQIVYYGGQSREKAMEIGNDISSHFNVIYEKISIVDKRSEDYRGPDDQIEISVFRTN